MFTLIIPAMLVLAGAEAPNRDLEKTVARINAYRKAAGLAPVEVDARLSRGCQAHAAYLARHCDPTAGRVNPHVENPKLAGYTKEGEAAGQMSGIHFFFGKNDPGESIDNLMAGFFHRLAFLRPDLKRIGFGQVNFKGNRWWMVLDNKSGRENTAKNFTRPVIYPVDRQTGVSPNYAENEFPSPIPAEGKNKKAGYPVTVMFPGGVKITDAAGTLADSSGKEVAVWFSSPEKPALRPEQQRNTICLIPKEALQPDTQYTATVKAQVDGKAWSKKWSFTTGKK